MKTVTLELDDQLYVDLEWFTDHYKEQLNADVTVAEIIVNLVDSYIDIASEDHGNTGLCGTCLEIRKREGGTWKQAL